MKVKYINSHFANNPSSVPRNKGRNSSYSMSITRDFCHLILRLQISSQEPFFVLFLTPSSIEEGCFSKRFLEPGDIEVAHKHPQFRFTSTFLSYKETKWQISRGFSLKEFNIKPVLEKNKIKNNKKRW